MRKLALAVLSAVVVSAVAYGQGTVQFNTRIVGTVDAKVFDVDGVTGLAGTEYTAQLFGGPQGTAESALTPLTPTTVFRTGTGAGYVVATANPVAVPGVPENGTATIQMRVWFNNGGAVTTYADAVAGGFKYGKSNILSVGPLGGTLTTPPALVGLANFSLVPEPSTYALLGLGALALLIRRRK
jgi:hypothetical protein